MRLLVSLCLYLGFSMSVLGCPDFKGEYNNCVNTTMKDAKAFKVKIGQNKINEGATIYHWQVEGKMPLNITADGKERTQTFLGPDSKTNMTVTTTAHCVGDEKIVSKSHTIYGKQVTDEVETLFKENGKLIWRSEVPNRKPHKIVDVVCGI